MITRRTLLLTSASLALAGLGTLRATPASDSSVTALQNGLWFDGNGFLPKEAWIIDGQLTFRRPPKVDASLDLTGAYLVPPFADAHNHGIGTGVEQRDRAMVARYLRDGVFYMQSMGNGPLTAADRTRLGLDGPNGVDAMLAQGTLTGHGGHPMGLLRNVLLPQGFFPGHTIETLKDYRFYEIDSLQELENKWPKIRQARSDFIKFFLFNSDEYDARRNDAAYYGRRGLDPKLAPHVVRLAHQDGLRAAAHVVNVADFRTALDAGVDIIAHLPSEGMLTRDDARRVKQLDVPVVTTCAFLTRLPRNTPQESAAIASRQTSNLQVLKQSGARIVIGSDDPADTTHGEIAHLRRLGVFTDTELLSIWTGETARTIFPARRIGALVEGHEASFLALEGNPLTDWSSTTKIRLRVKRGQVVEVTS
jgi:imidazolonepropionase-like amidohydrolase